MTKKYYHESQLTLVEKELANPSIFSDIPGVEFVRTYGKFRQDGTYAITFVAFDTNTNQLQSLNAYLVPSKFEGYYNIDKVFETVDYQDLPVPCDKYPQAFSRAHMLLADIGAQVTILSKEGDVL